MTETQHLPSPYAPGRKMHAQHCASDEIDGGLARFAEDVVNEYRKAKAFSTGA
jgi:hypothetical protein